MAAGPIEIGRICLFEDHDAALSHWQGLGIQGRVLIHIDAHHDLWWTAGGGSQSIASFLCEGVRNRLFRHIYWVVPDASVESRAGRSALRRHLLALRRQYGGRGPVKWQADRGDVTLLGCPITVCPLRSVPRISEPVLLDVDIDYLVIPRVAYGEWDRHSSLPWRWPAELVASLQTAPFEWDDVTIACSVNGGYTPMRWKYLGHELAARLRGADERGLRAYDGMRAAAEAEHRGDPHAAEAGYLAAAPVAGAPAWYSLAYLLAANGRIAEARECLARAIRLDDSYRSSYSTPGLALYRRGARDAAARAFQQSLQLDPQDAVPHVGLGWLAARRHDWVEAEAHARHALALQPDQIDAHRLLGESLASQQRVTEAIDAYEISLTLALAGHRPLDAVIVSDRSPHRLRDADHARTHARLARLHARAGDTRRAVAGYRIAVAGGYTSPGVQFALARLLAGERRWTAAVAAGFRGSVTAPQEAAASIGRAWRRWRLARKDDGHERVA